MPHTLVYHIFNMFSIFAANAKDPNLIHTLKGKCTIDAKPYDMVACMSKQLPQQLQMIKITTTKGIIFANPALAYPLFFPDSSSERKYISEYDNNKIDSKKNRVNNDKKLFTPTARDDKKDYRNIRSTYGIIINKTGSKLNLPNNLGLTYCHEFLDNDYHCHYGKKCGFKHAIFPKEFTPTEVTDINKWIKNTKCVSLNPTSHSKSDNK